MRVKTKGKVIKIPKSALHGKTKFDLVRKYIKKKLHTTSFQILKGK